MGNIGYIHSLQSMGAVDGPGLRYVIFVQGCPLRCMYCHNPDTWEYGRGTAYTVDELLPKILRCRPYFSEEGGVTVSGGEPLAQAEFVTELFNALHEEGIRTCLDTSGNYPDAADAQEKMKRLLKVTDLVISDIKFTTEEEFGRYTGGRLAKTLDFLELVTEEEVPLWIRQVIVPGYTDSEESISRLAEIAHSYPTLEKLELLPFRKLCETKYRELGIPFRCADIEECSAEKIEELTQRIIFICRKKAVCKTMHVKEWNSYLQIN